MAKDTEKLAKKHLKNPKDYKRFQKLINESKMYILIV